MCGLLTFLVPDGGAADRLAAVRLALPSIAHRGPDETATWHDDDLVHGFHRLAVVDLARSHQPLSWGPPSDPHRYVIAFNGEIYNHPELRERLRTEHGATFATRGDTEVLVAALHHWGEAALTRLRGMFAFALWDRRTRRLIAARDAFGIKPLYWASGPGGLALASEKAALAAVAPALGLTDTPDDLDLAAAQDYLLLQYVPEPATLHRAIRALESGCVLTAVAGQAPRIRRWFTPTFDDSAGRGRGLHDRIRAALRESVAAHLRADVPVGAFLSGGIDSTAIVALAREHHPGITAYTASFDEPGFSEADVAAQTATALGVRHVICRVTAQEVMDALPAIVRCLGDPVADPALVPLWFVARRARRDVTVVLSGEGADELFGGYRIYREPASLAAFEWLPAGLRSGLGRWARRIPEGVRGRDLLRRGALPIEQRYHGNARTFRPDQLPAVWRAHDPGRDTTAVTEPYYRASAGWDPVARMQHVDLFTWLRGDILVKADRTTMAHSLELRVPFLDPEVFAVARGLPRDQKIAGRATKVGLREALRDVVPPHVLHRRKLGFPVPLRPWLRDEMYGWAREILARSGAGHLVDLAGARRLLDEHRGGGVDRSRQVWTLLVFMVWHRIVFEERTGAPPDLQPAS
ncbi:MAG: asparagine synthase (glutamine-hydrolyzing) [Pseudonocardia sp.]